MRRLQLVSDWRPSENNRRAKYYTLTIAGKQQLAVERDNWRAFARAIEEVMATA